MAINSPFLILEINQHEYIFVAAKVEENNKFELIEVIKVELEGISENKISNPELVYKIIKENIYTMEQKLGFIFQEVILLINNFDCTITNFTGFKKLNGTQLGKDNITYILNSLKSKINETEANKKILHILTSKYVLDKKIIDNLPIGLFGNFYSQELAFFLINTNDYKNLKTIFDKCNLRIKKIISKNFIDGINIISNLKTETFIKIEINRDDIELIYFENSAIKYFQNFKFGANLILKDISKIVALNVETVENILISSKTLEKSNKSDFIEKEFFDNKNYRKIKKGLIFDIAKARIEEISEIVLLKNINLKSFLKKNATILLKINDLLSMKCFKDFYESSFSKKDEFQIKFLENINKNKTYKSAHKLVQYGWKKESVPIVQEKKSLISRLFTLVFD